MVTSPEEAEQNPKATIKRREVVHPGRSLPRGRAEQVGYTGTGANRPTSAGGAGDIGDRATSRDKEVIGSVYTNGPFIVVIERNLAGPDAMAISKTKRIKVSSEQELRNWLSKNSGLQQQVMIVTCDKKSRDKHISSEQVRNAVGEHGWDAGRSYTLDGNLVGHVISNF